MDSIFDLDHLYRTYFKMALPSVFGLMVSVVYNLADTFFIAQSNDTALIAGVSLCAPVFTALMAFGNIYGQGGSSLISRLLGQDDREGTGRVSSFCFYVALTTGVVLAALMMLFRVPLLGILGATAETMPHAQAYYTVLAIGAPATVLNFIHSNLVRCEGMATQSMIGSIGGTVINIILDPILITTVGWGAGGAAIATIVGYLCSDLYFLWLLHKKSRCLSVKLSQCHVTGRELQQILGVGVTAALSNLMQSLTVIVMNQFLLPYGNDKIAAHGHCQQGEHDRPAGSGWLLVRRHPTVRLPVRRKKAGRDAQAHPLLSDLSRLHCRGAVPHPLPEFRGADAALRAGCRDDRHWCADAPLAGLHRSLWRRGAPAHGAVPGNW